MTQTDKAPGGDDRERAVAALEQALEDYRTPGRWSSGVVIDPITADAILAALRTPADRSGEAVEGMVMVPKEPTEAMLAAGERERRERPTNTNPYRIWAAMLSAAPAQPSALDRGWQPIETAPKDGSWIVAVVSGADDRWEHLNGRAFVVRHEGTTNSGYDMGWSLHPGFGGVRDCWFAAWMPLPQPPALQQKGGEP